MNVFKNKKRWKNKKNVKKRALNKNVKKHFLHLWSEQVKPLRRDKSLFWHWMWVETGRPRTGVVADTMRRTRAAYHYAVRAVKKDEDMITRQRFADAVLDADHRNFWSDIKRIRSSKSGVAAWHCGRSYRCG